MNLREMVQSPDGHDTEFVILAPTEAEDATNEKRVSDNPVEGHTRRIMGRVRLPQKPFQ